jgi:hypothetical protein
MELRDKLNTKEKYIENIEFDKKCIDRDLLEYKEEGSTWDNKRIEDQFRQLVMYGMEHFIAKYSSSYNISNIIKDYKQVISFMQKGWQSEGGYVDMVWFLSIGILLEIEQEEFDKLITLVERDNLKDYLLDFLINYQKKDREQTNTFIWNKPYKSTQEIVELAKTDKKKALERLKKYLTKEWYRGHSDSGWHDNHKSKWGVHFGYWCWEAGALVKILGLDDSSLKDQQYYPYDMVHFKD